MDKLAKNFWTEVIIMILWVLGTTGAYIRYPNPSILFASSLGLTFYIAADIVLSHR